MPLGESMISILKSNKKIMTDKSRHFRKTSGGYDSKPVDEFGFPEATPEVLNGIREQIKKERRLRLIKISIVFILLVSIIVYLIV